ncbi:MAG: hypothetical protein F6K58_00305 [Symploca sp. SIO2E9]|nr:hypothetical protein [Symploca sp. SIO2E9]
MGLSSAGQAETAGRVSEKRCGEIIKQTLQTLQTLQTRRTQIPRKIAFTPAGLEPTNACRHNYLCFNNSNVAGVTDMAESGSTNSDVGIPVDSSMDLTNLAAINREDVKLPLLHGELLLQPQLL